MAFTKTDTADIEVSCDEAKFNFPHNRSGYRKFLQFIPPTKVFQLDKKPSTCIAYESRLHQYFIFSTFIYYLIE